MESVYQYGVLTFKFMGSLLGMLVHMLFGPKGSENSVGKLQEQMQKLPEQVQVARRIELIEPTRFKLSFIRGGKAIIWIEK